MSHTILVGKSGTGPEALAKFLSISFYFKAMISFNFYVIFSKLGHDQF